MHHPRLFKPESIANVQLEIQIVDTHKTLETRIVKRLQAIDYQINRTLLIYIHINTKTHFVATGCNVFFRSASLMC